MNPLPASFFDRKTLVVARNLVGCMLVRKIGRKIIRAQITETEAYIGAHDLGSHAAKGRTERTKVMFGPPGRFYIYFVYGVHWMLNVVTEKEEYPAGVLIRGIEGASGPGKLTKFLSIDGKLNGKEANIKNGLWFEAGDGKKIPIERTARIGIDYAGEIWANKKYRFVVKKKNKK